MGEEKKVEGTPFAVGEVEGTPLLGSNCVATGGQSFAGGESNVATLPTSGLCAACLEVIFNGVTEKPHSLVSKECELAPPEKTEEARPMDGDYSRHCMTLEEFGAHVRRLANGRAYTVSLVTTETQQSDGAGMRTLAWHAWIDGHRSGTNGDAHSVLRWLYEGKPGGLGAATGQGMAEVTVSGWAAKVAPTF